MTMHVDDLRLHDYLDGELDRAARAEVEDHAADCSACARRLAALAEVRTALDALPRAGRPALDLWPAISARLRDGADVVPLPVPHGQGPATDESEADRAESPAVGRTPEPPAIGHAADPRAIDRAAASAPGPETGAGRPASRRWKAAMPLAYAAGLVLAFAAGALTWTTVGPVPSTTATAEGPAPAVLAAPDEPPVRGRLAAASTYEEAIVDLESLLAEGRGRLDPATVRALEESLATIDQAIAEAEAALEADPGSELIRGMLLSQQRAKYRVLNRAASALLPRT